MKVNSMEREDVQKDAHLMTIVRSSISAIPGNWYDARIMTCR